MLCRTVPGADKSDLADHQSHKGVWSRTGTCKLPKLMNTARRVSQRQVRHSRSEKYRMICEQSRDIESQLYPHDLHYKKVHQYSDESMSPSLLIDVIADLRLPKNRQLEDHFLLGWQYSRSITTRLR
jgi:hypothetical protein